MTFQVGFLWGLLPTGAGFNRQEALTVTSRLSVRAREASRASRPDQSVDTCVERAFDLLGDSGKRAILFHLEHTFGLDREMIAREPIRFVEVLEQIFGVGAHVLEAAILANLEGSGAGASNLAETLRPRMRRKE